MNESYYLWAKEQMERELASDFASLKCLCLDKNLAVSWFLQVMASLPESERHEMWAARLKAWHIKKGELPINPMTAKELCLARMYMDKVREVQTAPIPWDESQVYEKEQQQKIVAASRVKAAKFRKMAVDALENVLGTHPIRCHDNHHLFTTPCRNGTIETYVSGGTTYQQLSYEHSVVNQSGLCIAKHCSVLSWLGISFTTHWSGITEDQVQPTVDALAATVNNFMDFCNSEWTC